jgi:voltage-gated sodium channel
VVVNAMQKEHEKAEALELEAEREIVHEEAAPILSEIRNLKTEVAALRKALMEKT